MEEFSAQFDKAFSANMAYLKRCRNTAVLNIGTKVIESTPFLTGALKGSWYSTLGEPSHMVAPRFDTEEGALAIADLQNTINKWEKGSLWMVNPLRYSEGVEFDSWSTTRPQGMVRVNLAGLESDFVTFATGSGRVE